MKRRCVVILLPWPDTLYTFGLASMYHLVYNCCCTKKEGHEDEPKDTSRTVIIAAVEPTVPGMAGIQKTTYLHPP